MLIEKKYRNHLYYVDVSTGQAVEKVCYSCEERKPRTEFAEGGGLAKLRNDCLKCEERKLVDEALYSNRISKRSIEKLAELVAADPSIKFAPKYDTKGRRWLFHGEKEDFKHIALTQGWKAARASYNVNQFVYTRLREELFTAAEIAEINNITPTKKMNTAPYQDYRLLVVDRYHITGIGYETWFKDEESGRMFFINNRWHHDVVPGDIVEFSAQRKDAGNNKKYGSYTQLYRVRQNSIKSWRNDTIISEER